MRFLYGDSTPFSLGYNFLSTLEAFMTASTRIVQLDHESRMLTRQTDEIAQTRIKGLEALDQFHTVVMRAVRDTAQKVQHAHALEYAHQVAGFASRHVEEHKRNAIASNEREAAHARNESERNLAEQRTLLEGFLKVARLPVLRTRVSGRLLVEGKDTRYQVSAVYENPDAIETSFTLSTQKAPSWSTARKVSEFLQGVDLMVGVDKSWLRGTVTPKQINVDDWIITQFDLGEDAFEVTLRRRLTEKDALSFRLRRTEGGLSGVVENAGNPTADAINGTLAPQDLASMERLWQALTLSAREITEHKDQLLTVSLDGAPVFEDGLVVKFVVRLVTMFAPSVREIAKRSPNEFELSLKMENDGGRREELYLRKDQLTSKLQPLSSAGRQVFAPLGLDTWVPGVTTAPPPTVEVSTTVGGRPHGVPSVIVGPNSALPAISAPNSASLPASVPPAALPPSIPPPAPSSRRPVDEG